MKRIKMEVEDVIKLSRGSEVLATVQYVAAHSGKKSEMGVTADRDVRIELFRDGEKVHSFGKRSPLNPENWKSA